MRSAHVFGLIVMLSFGPGAAKEIETVGVVSSATPEATAAGVRILEAGGNAIDAAVAVSLALAVTEPAGSGIAGQTVMLVKQPGAEAFVIHGTTWSPRSIPRDATDAQLSGGRTASTVPSTLRVLDLAHRKLGSGNIAWSQLVQPAIDAAEDGFVVGRFRHRAFRHYGKALREQSEAAAVFTRPDGADFQIGDRVRQPVLARTLRRIADAGAMEFYDGEMAREIARDMADNGGWITLEDLQDFPEPNMVPAIRSSYRGYTVETLPPPFGGWVVLQMLNVLEHHDQEVLDDDDSERRLALLDAMRIGHGERRAHPVTDYGNYHQEIASRTSKQEAVRLLQELRGGETTHFSVVDSDGMAVAVTQSIDSYFGAKVVHPSLGFLYNNYMQGFQLDDPEAPYYIAEREMPLSSMSATIVSGDGQPMLVLGSPGSARIISAVTQVTSFWIDVARDVAAAVSAYRVHVVPGNNAYIEGPGLPPQLLLGMAQRGLTLNRPAYGVADGHLDPYFGGVHAVAFEGGAWTGAADPRRDGTVGLARITRAQD